MRLLDEVCRSQQKSFDDHSSELHRPFTSPTSATVAMLNYHNDCKQSTQAQPKSIPIEASMHDHQDQHLKHRINSFHAHNNNLSPTEQTDIDPFFLSTIKAHNPEANMSDNDKILQNQNMKSFDDRPVFPVDEQNKCDTKVFIQNGNAKCLKTTERQLSMVNANGKDVDDVKRKNSVTSSVLTSTQPSDLMRFALGIMLTIVSAFFFSLTTVIVKYVVDIKASEMALYRFIGILLMVFPVVVESKEQWFGPNCWWFRLWMVLRGVCGATSLFFRYSAVSYISLADTTIIVLSLPVFVFIFARIFLKEPFGRFHVIALILSLVGICFASKIEFIFGSDRQDENEDDDSEISRTNQMIGTCFALGAMIIGSLVYVFVRKMRKTHHSVILFNFAMIAIVEMLFINYFTVGLRFPPSNGATPWLIMALGMLSFYGQLLLTKAVQLEEAGVVSVVRVSSEAFFAFVLQIIFFDQVPDFYSTIGAVLVLSSVILLTVRKYIVALPDGSHLKSRFSYLTK